MNLIIAHNNNKNHRCLTKGEVPYHYKANVSSVNLLVYMYIPYMPKETYLIGSQYKLMRVPVHNDHEMTIMPCKEAILC